MVCKTTEEIVEMLRSRSEVGLKKYGVSMDRTDLTHGEWCQHAIEEMLDGAQYLLQVKKQVPLKPVSLNAFAELMGRIHFMKGVFSLGEAAVLYGALIEEGYIIGEDNA